MGAGSSFEVPEQLENSSVSSVSGNSSGYHSYEEERDSISKLRTKHLDMENKKMSKPPFSSRPSGIIRAVTTQQQEREDELESKIVRKSPGLKQVFDGFEVCKKFLQDKSKKHEKFYESLNQLLQDNVIKTFSKYDKDEERMVMANRLARIK